MDRRWVAGAVALALMGAGLSGCRQDSTAPATSTAASSSRVSSSLSATPSDMSTSPTPTPSEDPLFTEAKKVHLVYLNEFVALEKAGGSDELPSSMKTVVSGDYETATENLFKEVKRRGIVASNDSSWKIISVRESLTTGSHAVAITACVDFRGMKYSSPNESQVEHGTFRIDNLQMKREGKFLVIDDGSSRRVEKCSA